MKILANYSSNYSKKTRLKTNIKFVIIHYTGMQSEIESINRLKSSRNKVSCHYLINRRGAVTRMVEDRKVAWHAGKSKWKQYVNLNKYSLGIELVNKGHNFGYQKFSPRQINSLIRLCKILKKKYSIKKENFLGHSDIAPLRKIDPGEKFPWKKLSLHQLGKWYIKKDKRIKAVSPKKIRVLFFKNLKKIGYKYFSVNKKDKRENKVIKSFQRHYLPEKINGKISQKTYEISHFLAN